MSTTISTESGRWFARWAALGLALPLLVVWSVHYPPQVDTPNHLARHYLEALAWQGQPLPPGYAIEYRILPNLGGDLTIPFLMLFVEPITAAQVFLSLALVLYWLGPALFILQCGQGRPSAQAAALLLLPFTLSSAFFWGFLNYYTGVGLAFLVLAHLQWLDRQAHLGLLNLLLHTVLVTLLFFCHLAAVFIYGVIGASLILSQLWNLRRTGSSFWICLRRGILFALPLVPAVVLFGLYAAAKAGLPTPPSIWGDPLRKMRMILTLFRGYDAAADLFAGCLWFLAVLACFHMGKPAPWPLGLRLALGLLLFLYLLMPFQWGSTSDADSRLLPPLLVCVLATLGTLPPRRLRLGLILLAAALLIRCGSIGYAWQRLDARLQTAARSFDVMEEKSRVLPVVLIDTPTKDQPEAHFISLAVIARHAYVPTLFAFADQQPLQLTGPRSHPWSYRVGVLTIDVVAAQRDYDVLWLYHPDHVAFDLPPRWERLFEAPHLEVYRIR